jgi:hypothetical protein
MRRSQVCLVVLVAIGGCSNNDVTGDTGGGGSDTGRRDGLFSPDGVRPADGKPKPAARRCRRRRRATAAPASARGSATSSGSPSSSRCTTSPRRT